MFKSDFETLCQNQYDFLIQRFGGPSYYRYGNLPVLNMTVIGMKCCTLFILWRKDNEMLLLIVEMLDVDNSSDRKGNLKLLCKHAGFDLSRQAVERWLKYM
jgi:truncated hemoglobin YjbI